MINYYLCERNLQFSNRKTGYKISLIGPFTVSILFGTILLLEILFPTFFVTLPSEEVSDFDFLITIFFAALFTFIIGIIYTLFYWDAIIFNKDGINLVTLMNKRKFSWNEIKKFTIGNTEKIGEDPDTGEYYGAKYVEIEIETMNNRIDYLIVAEGSGKKLIQKLSSCIDNEVEIEEIIKRRSSIRKYTWIIIQN